MGFHDDMHEDGFGDEQAYMEHLMNEAQERQSKRYRGSYSGSHRLRQRGWYVDAQEFFDTFLFLDKQSEEKLRCGNPLKMEVPCVAKKDEWHFLAFGLVLASDVDRIRALIDGNGRLDYGAFVNSEIPCLTASNNEDKGLIRTKPDIYKTISLGDVVSVDFKLWNDDLLGCRVNGVVEKADAEAWVP